MSAIADSDPSKPIEVLFAVQDGFDTLDVLGPLEIFHQATTEGAKGGKFISSCKFITLLATMSIFITFLNSI
jgi:hypothetical protein